MQIHLKATEKEVVIGDLSVRMLGVGDMRMLAPRVHLEFFNQASALADTIEGVSRVSHDLSKARATFWQSPLGAVTIRV